MHATNAVKTIVPERVRSSLVQGSYVCADVSQTKEKGIAICRVAIEDESPITISYYHQPFLTTRITHDQVDSMLANWPQELLSATCYSIDSPLTYARTPGGRQIDQKTTWERLGFDGYLNNDPKKAPTRAEAGDPKRQWIAIGMWLQDCLTRRNLRVVEVYPTASFNALHLWMQANVNLVTWFGDEPEAYGFIDERGRVECLPLRFLERLRSTSEYGTKHSRFRKLSIWPYPDLWDAFGGAITAALCCSSLTEEVTVADAVEEGAIVVPARLSTLGSILGEGND